VVVIYASKERYQDIVSISDLNVETNVINFPEKSDDYVVEGFIDLSNMQSGDEVIIREYVAVDGANSKVFTYITLRNAQTEPILKFPPRRIPYNGLYKVTITQTKGTVRSFPYCFIVLVYGTG